MRNNQSHNPLNPSWNRFSEFDELFERAFQHPFALFERVSGDRSTERPRTAMESWMPIRSHVEEKEEAFLLSLDVPGVKKEDLKIDLDARILTVTGQRSNGRFQRSFQLPETVNAEAIEAHLEDGVLQLALPKAEVSKSRTIQVQSGQGGFFAKILGGGEKKTTKTDDAAH